MADSFNSSLTSPLLFLDYKRTPKHPLPHHTSSQAFFFPFSFHRVQINSIFLYMPVLSSSNATSSWPHLRWSSHQNTPNFLQYMLTYVPHIISKNHTKRSPDAARASFTMTAAHCLYTSWEHSSCLVTTPPGTWSACKLQLHDLSLFKSCDLQIRWFPLSTTMSISYHYFWASPFPISRANCREHLYLSIAATLIKSLCFINSIFIILYVILALCLF
jgi:hypothetical protein